MTALTYQLEYVREVYGFEDIVLASEDGLAVAHAGDVWRSYLLAAFAAEYASHDEERSMDESFEPYLNAVEGSHITVKSFVSKAGYPIHLCAVSPTGHQADMGVDHASEGLNRIMALVA